MTNEHLSEIGALLDQAGRTTGEVVRGVPDARLKDPTPCADYTVHDLLNHLFHVVVGFQGLAAKEPADFSHTPDYLTGDWRARFGTETAALARAWSAPGVLDGVSPGMGMPQHTVAHMVLGDLAIHGWDLAVATGQDYTPDDQVLAEVAGPFAELAPTAREAGVFGPERPVPPDAGPFEKLLAATGRDPAAPVG